MMTGQRIGEVSHFFDKINVAVITIKMNLTLGDTVHFLGHGSDFLQKVSSMEIDHEFVDEAQAGQEIAIKVEKPIKKHTNVFLITADE